MQVIEKVKVVPEGYNGAGMDGYNRRSTGLLGAAGGGGMLGDGSTNINVVGAGIGAGTAAPSAFQAWA